MEFKEYQEKAKKTAVYVDKFKVTYSILGLANEAGEVAGKYKKVLRDNDGVITEEWKEKIKAELGDVLWYVSQVAVDLDLSLEEIAQENLDKLYSRLERGVIKGDGDKR